MRHLRPLFAVFAALTALCFLPAVSLAQMLVKASGTTGSTAYYIVPLKDIVNATDHLSGLTGQTGTVYLTTYRQGAGTVSTAPSTNNITEASSANAPGQYYLTLTQTECQYAGWIHGYYKSAGSDPVRAFELQIVGTDQTAATLPANITQVSGVNVGTDGAGGINVNMGQTLPASPTSGTLGMALYYANGKVGRTGTAQAGTSSTITLDSGANATDNTYKGYLIQITGGTGQGQRATIVAYNGTTKVATIQRAGSSAGWTTTPDSTSTFLIEPVEQANVAMINGQLVTAASAVTVPGTISSLTQAQVTGGNYSLQTDGSGYSKISNGTGTGQLSLISGAVLLQATQTGVTIPNVGTVTTLTNAPADSTSVTSIKGVTDKLATMLTASGGNWTYTVDAIKNAPTGSGGGTDNLGNLLSSYTTPNTVGNGLRLLLTGGIDTTGKVYLAATQTGVTIPTVTNLTNANLGASAPSWYVASPDVTAIRGAIFDTATVNGGYKLAINSSGYVAANVLNIDTGALTQITNAIQAIPTDGSISYKQQKALEVAVLLGHSTATSIDATSHQQTIVYYKQDGTTVLATIVVTYDTANRYVVSLGTPTFTNLP